MTDSDNFGIPNFEGKGLHANIFPFIMVVRIVFLQKRIFLDQ